MSYRSFRMEQRSDVIFRAEKEYKNGREKILISLERNNFQFYSCRSYTRKKRKWFYTTAVH